MKKILILVAAMALLSAAPLPAQPGAPRGDRRMKVIVDNDLGGDPDGLFALAHQVLCEGVNLQGIVGSTLGGGEHGDYEIEGIGNDFVADTMDMALVDRVVKVSDDEAFAGVRRLAAQEGIFAGSSSGATLAAAEKLAASGAKGNIVLVFADRAERYFSKKILA